MTTEEAERMYNIDQYDIVRYYDEKKRKTKVNNNTKKQKDAKFTNKDIMDKLDNIEKKIESIFTIIAKLKNE